MTPTGNPPAGACGSGPHEMGDPDLTPRPIDTLLPHRSPRMAVRRCAFCRHPLQGFRDALSAREAEITGQCQCCQDRTDEASLAIEREYAAHHGFDLDAALLPDDAACKRYDAAGPGAGAEADGFPQCAVCGYMLTEHDPCPSFEAQVEGEVPDADHPRVMCVCGYAWQLHRAAHGGPTPDQRTALLENDAREYEISRASHTQEAVFEPLAVALGVDDPGDVGAILEAMSDRLTKASGRPVYLHTVNSLTDLARFEAAHAARLRREREEANPDA
jgi:hypothetical protein